MNREDIIRMAREAGWTSYDSQDERFERFAELVRECEAGESMAKDEELKQAKREIKDLQNQVARLQRENVEIYGLLGAAHLNLRQHLKYGFSPATANSTLISVGQFYPKLKAEMEKNT